MGGDAAGGWSAQFLAAAHLAAPDDVPALIARHARALGADDAALYLVDYEQTVLVPVPNPEGPVRGQVTVDATIAGRSFRNLEILHVEGNGASRSLWVPVVDGAERLGVLELVFGARSGVTTNEEAKAFAALVAELVMSKSAYGDLFERVRRRRPMSIAAELAWQLLPPLTFGTERVIISAGLVPPYDVGGDSFDYAADATTVRVAVFDAMGHGLEAGLLATVAIAAYRNSRRRGLATAETVAAVDAAVHGQFGDERFVTAVLAELDLASGRLRCTLAGHPPPLLLRGGKIVKTLKADVAPPLGMGGPALEAEEVLQPGDQLVFFTDGVVEARSADGEFFGVGRLADLVCRASASGTSPPETLRRLLHAILGYQEGEFQDDATVVVLEWRGDQEPAAAPSAEGARSTAPGPGTEPP